MNVIVEFPWTRRIKLGVLLHGWCCSAVRKINRSNAPSSSSMFECVPVANPTERLNRSQHFQQITAAVPSYPRRHHDIKVWWHALRQLKLMSPDVSWCFLDQTPHEVAVTLWKWGRYDGDGGQCTEVWPWKEVHFYSISTNIEGQSILTNRRTTSQTSYNIFIIYAFRKS